MKRRSNQIGQCLPLLNCLGARRAATEVMFYRLPFVAGEPAEYVIVQRFVRQVLQGESCPALLPSDFRFRDKPLSFDASRFFDRFFLSGENAGTYATRSEMIQKISAYPVHQRRRIQIGGSYFEVKIFSVRLRFSGHARMYQLDGGKQFVFRMEKAGKHMNHRINAVLTSRPRPENRRIYGTKRRYKLPVNRLNRAVRKMCASTLDVHERGIPARSQELNRRRLTCYVRLLPAVYGRLR